MTKKFRTSTMVFFSNFLKFQVAKFSGDENARLVFAQVDEWINQEVTRVGLDKAIRQAYQPFSQDKRVSDTIKQFLAPSQLSLSEEPVLQKAILDLPQASNEQGVIEAILSILRRDISSNNVPNEADTRYAIWIYVEYILAEIVQLRLPEMPSVINQAIMQLPHQIDNLSQQINQIGTKLDTFLESFNKNLPIDYSILFHDFIENYIERNGRPVVFGGRESILRKLDDWLENPESSPYGLLQAPMGLGKTAVIIHWLDRISSNLSTSNGQWNVIFFPISIRFETNREEIFLQSITSQLAKIHGDPIQPNLNSYQLRVILTNYLRKEPPQGSQILIIIDGLDEAKSWEIGAGLLPSRLAKGIKTLISTRELANDNATTNWLSRLNLRASLVEMFSIDHLSKPEVVDVIHEGDPHIKQFATPAFIDRLYYLTEGLPLLVETYIEEIENRQATGLDVTIEWLDSLEPGLEKYFERWLQDQFALWGEADPNIEKAASTFRDLCAFALGPLKTDEILELAPEIFEGNAFLIEDAAKKYKRFIIGNGKQRGFVFGHPGMQEYFSKKQEHSRKAWQERFLRFGRWFFRDLEVRQFALDELKKKSTYVIQNYGAHLDILAVENPELITDEDYKCLLGELWLRVWEQFEGIKLSGGYLSSLERVHKRFESLSTPEAISITAKVAFCQSSGISVWSNISPEILKLVVIHGLISPVQGFTIMRQIRDISSRTEALINLVDLIPTELIGDALLETESISEAMMRENEDKEMDGKDEYKISSLLLRIALRYATEQKSLDLESVLKKLFERYKAYPEELFAETMCLSLDHFSSTIIGVVRREIEKFRSSAWKDILSIGLEKAEKNSVSERLITQAFLPIRKVKSSEEQLALLNCLYAYVPADKQVRILENAYEIIQGLINQEQSSIDRAILIYRLIQFLPEKPRGPVVEEIEDAIKKIEETDQKLWIFSLLAEYCGKEFANHTAGKLLSRLDMNHVSNSFESVLKASAFLDDEEKEKTIYDVIKRMKTMRPEDLSNNTFRYLPKLSKRPYDEMIKMARALPSSTDRAKALADLSSRLNGETVDLPILREAWSEAQTISDWKDQIDYFSALAINLKKENIIRSLQHIIVNGGNVIDQKPGIKLDFLIRMFRSITKELTEEEFDLLYHFTSELPINNYGTDKITALTLLCRLASQEILQNYKVELLNIARQIENSKKKLYFLCELAPILGVEDFQLLLKGLKDINGSSFEEYVAKIVPYLPDELTEEMIQTVAAVRDHDDLVAASTMSNIIPYLKESHLDSALQYCLLPSRMKSELRNIDLSALNLALLLPRLPEESRKKLIVKVVEDVSKLRFRKIDAILSLIPLVNPSLGTQLLLDAVKELMHNYFQSGGTYRNEKYQRNLKLITPHLTSEFNEYLLKLAQDGNSSSADLGVDCLYMIAENLEQNILLKALEIAKARGYINRALWFTVNLKQERRGSELGNLLDEIRSLDNGRDLILILTELSRCIKKLSGNQQNQVIQLIEDNFAELDKTDRGFLDHLGFFDNLCELGIGMRLALKLAWNFMDPFERNEVFWTVNNQLRGIFDNGNFGPIFSPGALYDLEKKQEEKDMSQELGKEVLQHVSEISDEEYRASRLCKLIPSLPKELHTEVLKTIEQMEEEENKCWCLKELQRVSGPEIRESINNILSSFEIDVFQFEGFRSSPPFLSSQELLPALRFIDRIDDEQIRNMGAYRALAPYLGMWCRAFGTAPADVKKDWHGLINNPKKLRRDTLFQTLSSIMPFTLSLIPGYGLEIANQLAESAFEVLEWWH